MTNKKFLFIGMDVLLSASLFFPGCSTDSEEENNSNNSTPNWYDGLGDGLTETDGTVTLTADNTPLSVEVTIPAGRTLEVPAGKTLTLTGAGALVGTDATSKLVLGANVTVGDLTAGTSVWHHAGWFSETAYNAAVTAAAALVTAFTATNAAVDASDATLVNLKTGYSVAGTADAPTVVPVNVTLATGAQTLTVPDNTVLSVAGTLNVTGAVTVTSGGDLTLDGATGTNTGTITIEDDGATSGIGGTDIIGTGVTVVKKGGKAYLGADENSKVLVISDDNSAVFQLTGNDATLSFNNAGYELDGVGTFNGITGGYDGTSAHKGYWISLPQTLTLTASSKLTVAVGSILGLGSEASETVTPRALGAAGASIISNGTIECQESRAQNFYPNNSETAEAYPGSGTFNWNETAGGTGKAGWKKVAN
jgi:hypothetical protein